jgi:hypothetical protein
MAPFLKTALLFFYLFLAPNGISFFALNYKLFNKFVNLIDYTFIILIKFIL